MDTQEKTLAEQFRSLQIATHRYLRGQYRKVAEEANKESRKAIMDKLFASLSEEEQKTMRSYLERVVEALKAETKESDDNADYELPFDDGRMGFYPHFGGFEHMGRRHGGHGHSGERPNGCAMPY
jgi:hypothetical protein